MCCFDKTGTLTSDNMVLRGLASLADRGDQLVDDIKSAGKDTLRVLAACQSLIQIDGELVGDPLERAAFEATGEHDAQCPCMQFNNASSAPSKGCCLRCMLAAVQEGQDGSPRALRTCSAHASQSLHLQHLPILRGRCSLSAESHAHPRWRVADHGGCPCAGWSMSGGAVVSPKEGSHRKKITVLHRFHFTSALKRMAVTVKASSLPCMLYALMHLLPALLVPPGAFAFPSTVQRPVALSPVMRFRALCQAGFVVPGQHLASMALLGALSPTVCRVR